MALNLDKTIQSALTRSHSRTLAKYTKNNMPTVHARTWTNETSVGDEWEVGNVTLVFQVVWVEVVPFEERADYGSFEG